MWMETLILFGKEQGIEERGLGHLGSGRDPDPPFVT